LYWAAVGRDDDYAVTLLAVLADYGVTVDVAKLRARVAELDRPRGRELS
jgi:hypothetical protein